MTFEEASAKAARDFLQTVLVVDNRAAFRAEEPVVALEAPDDLQTAAADAPARVEGERSPDALDAGAISEAFSCQGLVCSILRPTVENRLEEAVLRSAANADVLVLDWQMDDNGELATSVICRLIEADEAAGGRLRLIALYTGYSPLKDVHARLAGASEAFRPDEASLSFELGSARVVLLAKESSVNDPTEANFSVSEADLPERLVREFAGFAGGLLPNATLAAIAGLRRHTHRVLARFDKSLDGPYLTHRTLLPSPGDAEEFAADLIMSELDAQVPIDRIVSEYLDGQSVKAYLQHRMTGGKAPRLLLAKDGSRTHTVTIDKACELIEAGPDALDSVLEAMADAAKVSADVEKRNAWKKNYKTEVYDKLYLLAADGVEASRGSHSNFAIRSKLMRDFSTDKRVPDPLPVLQLGALMKGAERYWLCLTPLCDSGRIPTEGDRLLCAELVPSSRMFDLVVKPADQPVRLELPRKRTNLASFRFRPDGTGYVRGTVDGDDIVFQSEDDPPSGTRAVRFVWLGQLKRMHAQRIAQAFASNLARVGLDDFEWHRRQMPL